MHAADITSGSYEGFAAWAMFMVVALVIFGLLLVVLSPALMMVALMRRKAEKIMNERVNTVITQFDPPQDLLPAQMGLLYDMKCDEKELIATLFHLEQRGIIAIESRNKVKIVNEKAYPNLKKFEKLAIQHADGETDTSKLPRTSQISYTNPRTGVEELSVFRLPFQKKSRLEFALAIQESIEKKGIPMNNYQGAFTGRVLLMWFVIGLWPLLFTGAPVTSNGVEYSAWSFQSFTSAVFMVPFLGLFLFPVYILIACAVVWLWTRVAGRYWLNTKQARALWPELEGYRRYLEQVDLDNIQFESSSGHDPVTDTLPYAIIFGLETKWQNRLKNRKATSKASV